jgi:hypothetical protein
MGRAARTLAERCFPVGLQRSQALDHKCWKLSPDRRERLLSRIHVLTVDGASFSEESIFADGWSNVGSVHHL